MKRVIITIAAICALATPNVHAVGVTGKRSSDYVKEPIIVDQEKYGALIAKIEKYLSSFTTMESRFTQTATGRTQIRSGRILISRPGKARWEYMDPIKTTLTINNGRMSYYDQELDQISYTAVPDSPLEILLHKEVKFSGDVKIINIEDNKNGISITVAPTKEGNRFETLTMVFSKFPLQLSRLHRADANNHATTLYLSAPAFNAPLSNELFSLKNKTTKHKKN